MLKSKKRKKAKRVSNAPKDVNMPQVRSPKRVYEEPRDETVNYVKPGH